MGLAVKQNHMNSQLGARSATGFTFIMKACLRSDMSDVNFFLDVLVLQYRIKAVVSKQIKSNKKLLI